eukprot:CAMPEP_0113670344 /NCGR_PEP_ID=MMETSP0038_2-20120614/5085_1 /TAXON_ID=2898 /ORGANISM="Cryptomonas paramecium" /LENGTH=109 /DNA_ID=CAMNT_0000586351 /DNA_START=127 /DNA_END=453 /DNA_ORIENTATION=- /assembly_acc=CAM_ASM_000170
MNQTGSIRAKTGVGSPQHLGEAPRDIGQDTFSCSECTQSLFYYEDSTADISTRSSIEQFDDIDFEVDLGGHPSSDFFDPIRLVPLDFPWPSPKFYASSRRRRSTNPKKD